jgi:hypothetical protein
MVCQIIHRCLPPRCRTAEKYLRVARSSPNTHVLLGPLRKLFASIPVKLFSSVDARTSCTDGYGAVPVSIARPQPDVDGRRVRVSLAHRKPKTACPVPGLLRVENAAAGREPASSLAGSGRKARRKGQRERNVLTPARRFHGRRVAAIDAAHASRHTWRAGGARKASITREDLSGGAPAGAGKSRIRWPFIFLSRWPLPTYRRLGLVRHVAGRGKGAAINKWGIGLGTCELLGGNGGGTLC